MLDFVIIAVSRTGSTHLSSLLNSDSRIVVHPEIFHPNNIWYRRGSDAFAIMADISLERRDADVDGFLRRLKAIEPGKLLGCKLFPGHGDAVRDRLIADARIAKIVLYRENLLAMYASNKIAMAASQFHTLDKPAPDLTAPFDPNDFDRYATFVRGWYDRHMSILAETGQRFFFCPYEMLNEPSLVAGVRTFITGEPSGGVVESPHVKSGCHDVITRFANPDAVLAYLSANGLEAWRYDHQRI